MGKKKALEFRSKIGPVFVTLLYLSIAGIICMFWFLPIPYNGAIVARITGTCLFVGLAVMITWSICVSKYYLTDDALICLCGPVSRKIKYEDITEVSPSKSAWSSVALSFDRVKVKCGNNIFKLVYLSVRDEDKEFFMNELKSRSDLN